MWAAESDVIRVVVLNGHSVFARGLETALPSEEIEVVEVANTPDEALYAVKEHAPDVLIIDLHPPEEEIISAVIQLRDLFPDVRVLMIANSVKLQAVHEALQLGVGGFLSRDASPAELTAAVRVVERGGVAIAPLRPEALLAQPEPDVPSLAACELDVLKLVAQGLDNDDIACQLHLSVGSVKRKVQAILAKLKVKNRTQAAAYAGRIGLI